MMGIHHFETSTTAWWKRSLDRQRPLGCHSNSYSWKGKERTPPFGQTARVCTGKQTNLGFSEGILPRQLEFSFFDGEVNVKFEWSTLCALGRRTMLATALPPVFWDQPSGQCFSRSCRHCFVAVDVEHPLCGLPWLVVVVVLAMFRFAFVVLSSRLRATQVSPVVIGAGLHAGQVLFPSAWCVPSPSSFRGSLRLGELGVTVLCRVEYSCRMVAGLVILQEWTFVGTFPPLSEHFSYRSLSCLFSLHGGFRSISCSLVCLLFS